ncbi:MAG: PDZ domain-containing protein [Pirellulaceae bacterium]|nr:PDZ domain-containing protein [Pirellulaceae bacterium]
MNNQPAFGIMQLILARVRRPLTLLGFVLIRAVVVSPALACGQEELSLRAAPTEALPQDSQVSTQRNDKWEQLVADLQSPEFARRDSASKMLGATDFQAMVRVLPLLTAEDAEVAWRAKEVLIQQGVRGSDDSVRRIGLVLRLLTAAGYQQFAEDADKFESRMATLRVSDAVRRLESIPDIIVVPGPQFGGMIAGGNVLRIQRGVIIGQAQIAPQIVFPGGQIELLDIPAKVPNVVEAIPFEGNPFQVLPNPTGDVDSLPNSVTPPTTEVTGDAAIRQAYLKENLQSWLEQCVMALPEELGSLEKSWQATGVINVSTRGTEQVAQYFDLTITGTIEKEHVEILRSFFQNPVSVVLNMNNVVMSSELQTLLVESVEAGKLQYLNTFKCGYSMETCQSLTQSLKTGRLGYWQTQGRAMLGIMTDNQLLGRQDTAERGGARVGTVTGGSGAEKAGIMPGDLIRRIDDVPVENFEELRRIVAAFDIGDTIKVEIVRGTDDTPLKLDVTLTEYIQQNIQRLP